MAELLDHLRSGMGVPFSRPHADCCAFVADWVYACTGIDPAAPFRNSYNNEAEALTILQSLGGFEHAWKLHMALAGFSATTDPQEGDVGVVRDAAGQDVAAIRVHGGWAAKTSRGVVIEDFPMLIAWTVPRG